MSSLYVLAWIGTQRVAFDATRVESVVDIAAVVPVPLAAAHIVGLAAIRSQVITVIDCSVVTGGTPTPPTGRAIVTSVEGHRYALRVDHVDDVVAGLSRTADQDVALGALWSVISDGVIEVAGGFAVVLDPVRLVSSGTSAIAA
jgi:purine-binding chemotaxis protein CheW